MVPVVESPQSLKTASTPLPKNDLEHALYKFLQRANLLQYYSAFIEQGKGSLLNLLRNQNGSYFSGGGDDLKQLADAQNDDFQEIITLVGMASKPLHVKRFKKALDDYRQQLNEIPHDRTTTNHSYLTLPLRRLSTGEMASDRLYRSPLISSKPASDTPKIQSFHASTSWRLQVSVQFVLI